MMKILVTGATGFIGSNLVEELIKDPSNEVRCLIKRSDKFLKEWHLKRINWLVNEGVGVFFGDLLNETSLREAVKDVDIVYHLAAIARPSFIPNKEYFDINVEGTKNLINACKDIKKFVCVSSVSAVGPTRDGRPVNEETNPRPVDVYGESKLAMEKFIFNYLKVHKFPIVIVRPPMIYGPGDFEMLRMFKGVKKRLFPLFNGGRSYMEFCFVKNLVKGLILVGEKGKVGEIYHLSDKKSYTLREVIETIARVEGAKPPRNVPVSIFKLAGLGMEILSKIIRIHPPFCRSTSDWMSRDYWVSDISKAKKLGFNPEISLEEGIKRTVNWYKQEGLL